MSKKKSSHRARRYANPPGSPTSQPDGAIRQSNAPARRDARESRPLLERILDTPHLEQAVPRLQPELLHRVIQNCGLEDCGELLALATPDQLARVFDLDLWRAEQPGFDEQFDADRFGVWLEVLVESGANAAAQKLVEIDVDLVTAGLAQHTLVFDIASVTPYATTDGEEVVATTGVYDRLCCDLGGYRLVARRTDSWDAIIAVLISLEEEHRSYFHRVMSGCRTLSNSKPEIDGLNDLLVDGDQVMFDLAVGRDQRREQQGYVTPAQASAFLQMSRHIQLAHDTKPPANPLARAYFRAIDEKTAADASSVPARLLSAADVPDPQENSAETTAAFVAVLLEAGILPPQPRALLEGPRGEAPRLVLIRRHMQLVCDSHPLAYSTRNQELAYLANVIVAGSSIQARPIKAQEASDAAVAVCNLGLENWPVHWLRAKPRCSSLVVEAGTALPRDFLSVHDLVSVFQVGWTVLHEKVCMYAAQQLIEILTDLRCDDRETQAGLNALRRELTRHWQSGAPWRARGALDVITILDMPAWAALLGLIDECPVMHAGIGATRDSQTRAVSAYAFEFISENSQIASVREFMQALPEILRC